VETVHALLLLAILASIVQSLAGDMQGFAHILREAEIRFFVGS
jgi:hypothetical protein